MDQTQILYPKPPADDALPDPEGTFYVVHTPFDAEATSLEPAVPSRLARSQPQSRNLQGSIPLR